MHIRVPAETRDHVHNYAQTFGITDSAAAAILLRRGLDADIKEGGDASRGR